MEEKPKVLIGIVTYEGHKYCLEPFIKSLKKFTYENARVVIVDGSKNDEYAKEINSLGFSAVRDEVSHLPRGEQILSSRKFLQQFALENGFDYLFFLDSDVIAPPDVIERLLIHNKDIVTGVYLNKFVFGKKAGIAPVLYVDEKPGHARLVSQNEVIDSRLMEIGAAGLGCCLISRKVLEKATMELNKEVTGEDVSFFMSAKEHGFKAYADTSVKCRHLVFPEHDKRNQLFSFDKPVVSYEFAVK